MRNDGRENNQLRKIKFTVAPKSCEDGNSILLLNNSYMNFDEIFNILISLFYDIHKVMNSNIENII